MSMRETGTPFARRLRTVMLILSVACFFACATGCAPDVVYLRDSEKVIHLSSGECAPRDGWLLSDDQLSELHDLLELERMAEDRGD